MRRHPIVAGSMGALAMALAMGACGDPSSSLPPRPSALTYTGIEISGPDRVAPGQTAQFTAMIRLSDGTRKAASAVTNVTWTTSDSQFLRVNSAGLATAQQQRGDATVRASVARGGGVAGTIQSAKEVTVLPDGTFRVVGMVRDAEFPTQPVFGARIEVTPGQLVAISDLSGRFTLYGVPAEAELRITREGFLPSVHQLRLTSNMTQDFALDADGPRTPVTSGSYILTVDVAGACSNLPGDLQHRRYEATLTSNGLDVEVTLTEPRFQLNSIKKGNRFSGRVAANGATFTLTPFSTYYYYYSPSSYLSIVEVLTDGSVLEIEGTFAMKSTPAGLSGQVVPWGGIVRYAAGFPQIWRYLGGCFASTSAASASIVMTLTPR